jgi:hypothetical protein
MFWKPHIPQKDGPDVVMPEERLSWPRTLGIGMQHVVNLFQEPVVIIMISKTKPREVMP